MKSRKQQTGADELDRMTPVITEILLADIAIESSGKKMIHTAGAVVFAPGGMPAAFQLANEVVCAFAALGPVEGEELAGSEVAGVHGYQNTGSGASCKV